MCIFCFYFFDDSQSIFSVVLYWFTWFDRFVHHEMQLDLCPVNAFSANFYAKECPGGRKCFSSNGTIFSSCSSNLLFVPLKVLKFCQMIFEYFSSSIHWYVVMCAFIAHAMWHVHCTVYTYINAALRRIEVKVKDFWIWYRDVHMPTTSCFSLSIS